MYAYVVIQSYDSLLFILIILVIVIHCQGFELNVGMLHARLVGGDNRRKEWKFIDKEVAYGWWLVSQENGK